MFLLPNHGPLKQRPASWRGFVIGLAVAGLICSLATRTFQSEIPHGVNAQSADLQPIRQHLDSDAVQWVAPVAVLIVSDCPTLYPQVAPTEPPCPRLWDEPLYNRPPPYFS